MNISLKKAKWAKSLWQACYLQWRCFWKQHWVKHLLCMNWSTCAGSGASQACADSSSVATLRNFVCHSPDSALHDTHPPAFFRPCLLPTLLPFFLSASPVPHHSGYTRVSIPACQAAGQSWSLLPFQSLPPRLCQNFRNIPTLEGNPTSLQTPSMPPECDAERDQRPSKAHTQQADVNREKSGPRSWRLEAPGRREGGAGNNKHGAANKYFYLLLSLNTIRKS